MTMNRSHRIVVNWGHLALLAVIGSVIAAYLLDTRATSLRVNNLLFVQPAALIGLLLVLLVVPQCFRRRPAGAEAEPAQPLSHLAKAAGLMAALVALALSMERIGFDVATFCFLLAALRLCGERNWFVNLGYSAVFTAILIYGYGTIIPFPFPLTIL
ncbi:tripartite tricarboxylate transporter TctB family protein [Afifella pfennigii]|uniref:tripartite tricarboxylate transporter TctB family protein n=1 Tax=Afifella pfennigii TaxID=209897 RepID=UPI00047A7F20|nr:tripartite tricarboxylate transporter TctB family protein [Afifella pfennigii]